MALLDWKKEPQIEFGLDRWIREFFLGLVIIYHAAPEFQLQFFVATRRSDECESSVAGINEYITDSEAMYFHIFMTKLEVSEILSRKTCF